MDNTKKSLLNTVADINEKPEGAYNIRVNGKSEGRASTKNIRIESRDDGKGINIFVAPGTKNEFAHIPVVIDNSGLIDEVYNDFYIGENCDIQIVAGCGIHNDGEHLTQHDGIHTFHIGENSKVKYIEKHYGEGGGSGENILNPITILHLKKGSFLEMESMQIEGVNSTKRVTQADIADDASLVIKEIIMTSGKQTAITDFKVDLNGENSSATVASRSVAKDDSKQYFYSEISGNNACTGHSECDAIIMDNAMVKAVPDVTANHVDASLIHEAAIGKIAGAQITKLMTLGLTEEEAEKEIVSGFLR
ncbi:SufB/SufD family protein [Miniphocaeibacter massiliensis]|uniref:SufB/SufD family protein n=1 Tax=Miniphocaeibacter massiliensis TaxID=2041841 RepID=UPI000C1C602E|nr:SufD family Fe-S cluster assembly protein [Miniphocaeibacter massiliensis]